MTLKNENSETKRHFSVSFFCLLNIRNRFLNIFHYSITKITAILLSTRYWSNVIRYLPQRGWGAFIKIHHVALCITQYFILVFILLLVIFLDGLTISCSTLWKSKYKKMLQNIEYFFWHQNYVMWQRVL